MKEIVQQIENNAIIREPDKSEALVEQIIDTGMAITNLVYAIKADNVNSIEHGIANVFKTLVVGNMLDRNYDIEKLYYEDVANIKREFGPNHKDENELNPLYSNRKWILQNAYDERAVYYLMGNLMVIAIIHNLDFENCIRKNMQRWILL